MTGAETIIRIYLCTSYADMQAERAFLHHFVFPKVAQKFLKKGFRLVIVDPCWGARSESEAEGPPTLERRFQAIEQCRPFFLGFVGSRENTIIEQIPFELGRKFPLIQHYSRSSQLQLEILLGAVRDPSRATHAFFYFRKPDFLKDVPPEQQAHFVIEDPLAARKFENFKGAVRAAKLPVYDYNCGWDHEAGCVTGLDELGKRVIADLLTVLSRLEREATTRSVKAEPPKPAVEQRKPTTASVPPPPVKAAPPKPAVEQPKPTTAPAPPPPVKAEPPKPAVEQRKPTTASVPPPPVKAEPPKPAVEQPKPTTASVPPPAVKAEPPKPAVEQPKPTTAPVPPPAVKAEPPKPAVEQPKPTTAPVPPPAVKAEPPKRVVEPQKPVVEPGLSPAAQLAADSERESGRKFDCFTALGNVAKAACKKPREHCVRGFDFG
ncbi:MAG: hypothetical protein KatS3mg105_2108 [Gemmatales bacterium]|nr:MAG: hypothetical protein KatS3mg105_2108 [Gemmatales bacterium]